MSLSRRPLSFSSLEDAVRDAEALRDSGYQQVGDWNLSQVCRHLSQWMQFPLDGFPKMPAPVRGVFWVMRKTIGRRQLAKILSTNSMPVGTPTIRSTVPAVGGDEAAAIAQFRETVKRFTIHQGPLVPSPLFGDLDYATATKLQLIHCAHHLSFLIPNAK